MSALVIRSVETTIVDLPLVRPHAFSTAVMDHQSLVLVRIRTEDGVEGIGEGSVPGGPWWGGDSVEAIAGTIDSYLGPLLLGEDAVRVERIRARLDRAVPGNPVAKNAIEIALFDAAAKARGLRACELMGGLCRESLAVRWALSALGAEAMLAEAEERLAAGYPRLKVKMGALPPDDDVARTVRLLDSLRDVGVLGDPNGMWDEWTALRCIARLADAGLEMVEQPVAGWNRDALRRVARRSAIPIMADEALQTPQDALALTHGGAAASFSVKLGKSGGPTRVRRIAAIAEAAGVGCYGGTSLECSIGTAAALHTFCALPELSDDCELVGPLLLAADIVEEPLVYEGGRLHLPPGPGFGMRIDEAALRRHARAGSTRSRSAGPIAIAPLEAGGTGRT